MEMPISRDQKTETDEAALLITCKCGKELLRVDTGPIAIECGMTVECPECGMDEKVFVLDAGMKFEVLEFGEKDND